MESKKKYTQKDIVDAFASGRLETGNITTYQLLRLFEARIIKFKTEEAVMENKDATCGSNPEKLYYVVRKGTNNRKTFRNDLTGKNEYLVVRWPEFAEEKAREEKIWDHLLELVSIDDFDKKVGGKKD